MVAQKNTKVHLRPPGSHANYASIIVIYGPTDGRAHLHVVKKLAWKLLPGTI